MKNKPLSPLAHGIIDYVFSAALLFIPRMTGLKKKAVYLYTIEGISTIFYSAVTDYPLGVKPVISYKTHRAADCANIALLAASTLYKPVSKDKWAMLFSITMASAALITILLTNWNAETVVNDNKFVHVK